MIIAEDSNHRNNEHRPRTLLETHRRELEEGSGIEPGVIAKRGYSTVTAEKARALGFAEEQAREGLLIPFYAPDGEISYQLKPKEPRTDRRGKPVKYETRAGYDITLDVHPDNVQRLMHGADPIYVVEGIKKADSASSRGRLVVGLSGVWNWGRKRKRGGAKYGRPELLPEWSAIPLEGRKVYVCFDADHREKQSVALAMLRLAERLQERDAHVYIMSLPSEAKGLDDYIVAGGDLAELEESARPFTPSLLLPYAAKDDAPISAGVASLLAAARRDNKLAATTHSLLRALGELALLGGRYDIESGDADVVIGTRELRSYAAIGSNSTLSRHTAILEESGYIVKVPGDAAKGKANRYVLKLSRCVAPIESRGEVSTDSIPATPLDNFTPHLRWPAPASTAPGGDERDSKLPPQGATPENFPHEKPNLPSIYSGEASLHTGRNFEPESTLGKTVEQALYLLLCWGGISTLRDLATATGINHTGKLRRKLEAAAGVFGMDAKGKHGARVWLCDNWERALDEHGERSGEFRRARQQAVKLRENRDSFASDLHTEEPQPLMGPERVEKIVSEREKEESARKAREAAAEQEKAKAFVREMIEKQPRGFIRFGLLVEIWAEEQSGTKQHATWTLRKALGTLNYSLIRHAEIPGEMFIYAPQGSKAAQAGRG
jgi:hypothetical protein